MADKLAVVDITGQAAAAAPEPAATSRYGPDQVGPRRRVRMHFSLSLSDGETIDSNFGGKPVEFDVGDGNVLPGFERSLYGLRGGDEARRELPPEQAFGDIQEANVLRYPRYQFPADLPLETGVMVSFSDAAGNEQAGVVRDFDKTSVTVDFNHPLAGRTIVFTVRILSVQATDEP